MLKKIVPLTLGAVVSALLWTTMAADAGGVPGRADCRGLAIPANATYASSLNPYTGTLDLKWQSRDGTEHAAVIDYAAPSCRGNPTVRAEIERAEQVAREIRADECASMREFLASGATVVRGVQVNREAGARFVAQSC